MTIQNVKVGGLLLALVMVLGACGGTEPATDTTEAASATEAVETTVAETAGTTGDTEATTAETETTTATEGGGDGDPIVLGTAFPLSGPGSYFGVQNNEAIDLILEQWGGSVDGHPIEVHSEDSQCSPLEATNAAERLVNEFEPDIIFGEECSSATLAIMPIVERAGVPLVNAGSSSILITEPGNDWTFRIMPNEVMQGISIATNAVNELGASRAVILHENTDAGIGNADAFTETFESMGGEVVDRIGFDREVQDFTSIASRIAGLDDIDVIPTYSLEGQGVNITQALAQAGVTPGGGGTAIQLGTIWLPDTFEEKAGASAEGYIRILQYLPEDPRPIVQDFVSAFEEKYDRTPTHINAHTYDLMQLLKDVIERGGTDPESIRTALMETDGLEGVTGHITFDETGQNIETDTIHYVRTLADGTLEVLDWEP